METLPSLPTLIVGGHAIRVAGITGHGASRACIAIDGDDAGAHEGLVTRDALVGFAIGLLDICEQMIEDTAYGTSDSIRSGAGKVSTRYRDGVRRFYRIRDRLPILQLAQSVLETADDKTANILLTLLAQAKATGSLPINVAIDITAASQDEGEPISQKREPGDSTH
ncbi:hypothetical protein OHC51_21620 [Stenotrophomonas indicatrix]|uniref:hypothetical protein n=1 Tax=Stenotrophomonas indicatrix TaxID=2045451 RepID=UPI003008F7D3